ncbi:MAG: flagellar biosynthetic protein FliO [Thermodesulfobacteriota bacterium]
MARNFLLPVVAAIVAASLLLSAAAAAAQEAPGGDAPDLFLAGFKMAGALILVIAGLWLTFYLLRRSGLNRTRLFGGQEIIRIIATRALAPKKYIALVEVGDSVLTLGVTAEHISCLDKTPADAFKAGLEGKSAWPARRGFSQVLDALTNPPVRTEDHT